MSESQKTLDKILNFYNPVKTIKESKVVKRKHAIIAEAKAEKEKTVVQAKKAKEEKTNLVESSKLDETEKAFVSKFIEYNELNLLANECEKLIPIFNRALGPNAQIAIDEIEARCKERQETLDILSKELIDIKQQLMKEAEKVKTKESLIALAGEIKTTEKPSAKATKQDKKADITPEVPEVPETNKDSETFDETEQQNIIESKKKKK